MSPAKVLWHQWALEDAITVNKTMACFKQDTETWVEARMVARILRDWPSAARAIVSGWYVLRYLPHCVHMLILECNRDFASHDEHMHTYDMKFYIHIEYVDRRNVRRYVLFVLHATDLDGKEGRAMSLDENAELVQDEMDEVARRLSYDVPYEDDADSTNMPSPTLIDSENENGAGCSCIPPWMI